MKTLLFTSFFVLIACTSFSQNNYTLNGNLGIGGSPSEKLSVNGNSRMSGELTVTQKAKLQGDVEVTGDMKLVNLTTTGTGFERLLYLDENGNIKKATDGFLGILFEQFYLERGCSGTNDTYLPQWVNNVNKMYLHNTCGWDIKVGIGTPNPSARLHVVGSENGYQLKIRATTAYSKSLAVVKNGVNQFLVNGNGRVSILNQEANVKAFTIIDNTDSDVFRVMGDGLVFATEIKVRLKESFPDYVFEDGYPLMSLHDLENYIKQYRKLPKMPAAGKVSTEGLDLGENTRLLTEKVEELTLYILQLKAEIDALRNQVEANQDSPQTKK